MASGGDVKQLGKTYLRGMTQSNKTSKKALTRSEVEILLRPGAPLHSTPTHTAITSYPQPCPGLRTWTEEREFA